MTVYSEARHGSVDGQLEDGRGDGTRRGFQVCGVPHGWVPLDPPKKGFSQRFVHHF